MRLQRQRPRERLHRTRRAFHTFLEVLKGRAGTRDDFEATAPTAAVAPEQDEPRHPALRALEDPLQEGGAQAQKAAARLSSKLEPAVAEAYLDQLAELIAARSVSVAAPFVVASERAPCPVSFLSAATELAHRPGLSGDCLVQLGKKANANPDVPHFVASTALSDELLDFLGRDLNSGWDKLQKVIARESDTYRGRVPALEEVRDVWVQKWVRGAAGEWVVRQTLRERGAYHLRDRQGRLGHARSDFTVVDQETGEERGVEVKTWMPDRWKAALRAYRRFIDHPDQAGDSLAGSVHSMFLQLWELQRALEAPPVLLVRGGMSSDLEVKFREFMHHHFPEATLQLVDPARVNLVEQDLWRALWGK